MTRITETRTRQLHNWAKKQLANHPTAWEALKVGPLANAHVAAKMIDQSDLKNAAALREWGITCRQVQTAVNRTLKQGGIVNPRHALLQLVQTERHEPRGRERQRLIDHILKRDGNQCAHCGDPIADPHSGKEAELDHIQPLNQGGSNEWDNWQLLHATCNKQKGGHRTSA